MKGSDEELAAWGFEVRHTVPLFDSRRDQVLLSADYGLLRVDTGARLPRTPEASFPEELQRLGLAASWRRELGEGRSLAMSARVGSASDRLFSEDSTVVSAWALTRLPDGGGAGAWILGLAYQSDRETGELDHIPLPVVGYQRSFGRRSWMLLGIPFLAAHLESRSRVKLDLSYAPVRNVRARLGYGLAESLDLYCAFAWETESYRRADRDDREDRLVFCEKRLVLGLAHRWGRRFSLGLEAGWSFDRCVYEDEDYDDRKDNWLQIDDAACARLVLRAAF